MKKYIIKWNAGYGDQYEEIEAKNEEDAADYAYESWRENTEAQADYGVVGEWTKELADDYL